jgi:dipeptidyl aminopeptidase/acylaminoacyl peptidase
VRAAGPLLALGAALLFASCGGSGDSDPDLLVVSTRDGDYAIYGMSATGKAERRLTDADVDASTPQGLFFQIEPAWSPDDSTIVFASKRSGTLDLYAMSADGSGTRRLTSTKDDDGQPDWSPDGKQIVFARGTPARLFVMGADGAGARRLTDSQAEENEPAWSPDGRSIAYSRRDPGSSIRELWLVRPDGSQTRRLTKLGGVAQAPSWSPDGRRIAFSANVDEKGFDLYTVDADGTNVRLVTSGDDSIEPAWSPDGKTIAFSEAGAIVAIDVVNGEEQTLTDPDNNDSSPTWKPEQGGTQ